MTKRIIVYSLIAIFGLTQLISASPTKDEVANMKKIVGYFPNWGVLDSHRKYFVSKIPFDKLTHVQVAFAGVSKDFKIVSPDPWFDFDNPYGESWNSKYKGIYGQLKKLKVAYPHLSVLVSIGGWTLSGQFAFLDTDKKRAKFAENAVEFAVAHDLDGVDIDWEFPTNVRQPDKVDNQNDQGTPYETQKSKQYFTLTLKELRKKLDEQGEKKGKYYQLTAAVSANPTLIDETEPKKYSQYLDFVNVMTYDLHGAYEDRTNHQSPIYPNPYLPDDNLTAAYAAKKLVNLGVPKDKIVIGAPFYSRGWKGVECEDGKRVSYVDANWVQVTKTVSNKMIKNKDGEDLPGLYCYGSGGAKGRWDGGRAAGVNSWYDIVNKMIDKDGFQVYRDQYSQVPYLYSATKKEFYTYEDELSAQARVKFVKEKGYGGIIIWELSADTRPELGDPSNRSLLDVIYKGFYEGGSVTETVDAKPKPIDNNQTRNVQTERYIKKSNKGSGGGAATLTGKIAPFDPEHGPKWNKHYGKGEQVSYLETYICTAKYWVNKAPSSTNSAWSCVDTGEQQKEIKVKDEDINATKKESEEIAKLLKKTLTKDDITAIKNEANETKKVASKEANSSEESGAGEKKVNIEAPSAEELKAEAIEANKCHKGQVYLLGDSCLRENKWYEFKYWTSYKGNVTPSMKVIEKKEAPKLEMVASGGIPDWSSSTTYSEKGMKVVYNNHVYESKYWTQGDMPKPFVATTPWKYIGYADKGIVANDPGKKAPTSEDVKKVNLSDTNLTIMRATDKKSTTATLDPETNKTVVTEATPEENVTKVKLPSDDKKFFMPFVDVTMWPPYDFNEGMKDGVKNFVISFVNSASGVCSPTWGNFATYTIENSTLNIPSKIKKITDNGGMVMISFGGATAHNDELANACKSVKDLTKAYQEVIKQTGVKMLDFDIEGINSYNQVRVKRRMKAIKQLQDDNEDVEISFTLATMPTGLMQASGLMILKTALAEGVKIKMVNLMLMDYGLSFPANVPGELKMAAYSIQALQSVNEQLKKILPDEYVEVNGNHYNMLGAIAMIGRNDTLNEYFYRDDAEKLREFADLVGVRMTSMWSLNRDKPRASSENEDSMLFMSTKLKAGDSQGKYGKEAKNEFSKILERRSN